eukprot:9370174-Prorocentrum_lima.AAC.1
MSDVGGCCGSSDVAAVGSREVPSCDGGRQGVNGCAVGASCVLVCCPAFSFGRDMLGPTVVLEGISL